MTDSAPTHRRRTRAALLALTAALATALPIAGTGTAHAEMIPHWSPSFELRNVATNKCLEVADWRKDDGAPVRQWTCHGGRNQQWMMNTNFELVSANSGTCLTVPGGSTVPPDGNVPWGAQLFIQTCMRQGFQWWGAPGVNSPSVGTVSPMRYSVVADVAGGDPSDGAPVIAWGYNGGANQYWIGLQPPVTLVPR
ncbi:RICIN domain-containing protein [Kitasatospora sp. NPDC057692]|uniref:RICIN domain-containing protein n=1 Tax=Kitasatospora sp. NPDC057692 TaxID=3346215 RepID=UPI0036B33E6A